MNKNMFPYLVFSQLKVVEACVHIRYVFFISNFFFQFDVHMNIDIDSVRTHFGYRI